MPCHAGGQDLNLPPAGSLSLLYPWTVQGMLGCGTQCSGLGHKAGMGHRLDSMVSEAFSNLDDFVFGWTKAENG